MLAERDGGLERGDEDFAIRTGSQMSAYFPANVEREFIVDIGRQLPEKIHAMALSMRMAVRRWLRHFLWHRRLFLGHERKPPDLWSSRWVMPRALSSRRTHKRDRCSRDFTARSFKPMMG